MVKAIDPGIDVNKFELQSRYLRSLSDKYPRESGIVVCEFVLQSRYYVHFRANTLGKGMNPRILPAMG